MRLIPLAVFLIALGLGGAAAEPTEPSEASAPSELTAAAPAPDTPPEGDGDAAAAGADAEVDADAAEEGATRPVVAILRVEGMIYDFVLESLQRRLERALEQGATTIVIELDTPGGMVTSALDICRFLKSLRSQSIRTVAWINDEAYSAGIMIASSCDYIVMTPASATGDCAPIQMGQNLAPTERAKALSPILEEFRDSATRGGYEYVMFQAMCALGVEVYHIEHRETGERMMVNQADYQVMVNGKSVDEANAMTEPKQAEPTTLKIDESTVTVTPTATYEKVSVDRAREEDRSAWKLIKRIHDGTTLLTVNQTRAAEIGLSKATIADVDALSAHLGAQSVTYVEQNWSEALVAWLVHPMVRMVLIGAVLLGAYMEFQSPGLGLPGAVAGVALVILLGAPFLVGLAEVWHVVVFFIGFLLLLVEVFVTPGFAVMGITGLIMMFAGLVLMIVPSTDNGIMPLPAPGTFGLLSQSAIWTLGGFVLSAFGFIVLISYAGSLPGLRRLVHDTQQQLGGVETAPSVSGGDSIGHGYIRVGALGTVVADLRPTGRADFSGHLVDVVCDGQWISVGAKVRVMEVQGNRVLVETA